MDLVTVIVPVYNAEKYLERCVDSILRQTYTNLEIILIDDGSPDRSGELCDAYARKDERVRVIHRQNGGVSAARNTGLDAAKGAWIMFVDSDDFIAPDAVEYLLKLCWEHGAKAAQCGRIVGKDESFPAETAEEQVKVWDFWELYTAPQKLYLGTVWAKLFDASLFREIRFPEGMLGEDLEVAFKAFYTAKRIASSHRRLYYCYLSENSLSRTPNPHLLYDVIAAFEGLLRWLEERGEDGLIDVTETKFCKTLIMGYFRAVQLPTKDEAQKLRKLFLVHYGAIKRKDRLPAMEMAALRLFRFCPNVFAFAENKLHVIRARDRWLQK